MNLSRHPAIGTAFRFMTLTATWSAGAAVRRRSAPGSAGSALTLEGVRGIRQGVQKIKTAVVGLRK
jgi:uncharacterized membrane protein